MLAVMAAAGAVGASIAGAAHAPVADDAAVLAEADAVLRGRIEAVRCVRDADGRIRTEAAVAVRETFKGRMGGYILVSVPGGRLDGEGDIQGCGPHPDPGTDFVIAGRMRADGRLEPLGGADGMRRLAPDPGGVRGARVVRDGGLARLRALTPKGALAGADLTASDGLTREAIDGMSTNSIYGAPSRFLACDRGEAIAYLVDLDALPAGIAANQALAAVSNAFAAWSAVTSLVFTNGGISSFGTGADQVATDDRRIRVQMHDLHNRIAGGNTLGIGGRGFRYDTNAFPSGGLGARVGTNEFDESTRGYIVLEHTNVSLQVVATLQEVLGHEVGHVLSLAHTSEDPDEADSGRKEALMYYRAHADGRGAALATTDVAHIRLSHPSDTPPWSYDRILDAVTGSPVPPAVTGVNETFLPGYDLQGLTLTGILVSASTGSGDFSLTNGWLRFVPNGYYDAPRLDPGGSSYYGVAYVRFLEASNASPPARVRVISLQYDTDGTSDGLPVGWMTNHFGHADPLAGDLSRADDDRDGDGHSNLEEFLSGTDPTNALSVLHIASFAGRTAQWTAAPYHLYEVQASTELVSVPFGLVAPVQPTGTTATAAVPAPAAAKFLRIRRVP
jgi:hypothetical protein